MLTWFVKGGPLMWPILICSILTFASVIERIIFLLSEKQKSNPKLVHDMWKFAEHGKWDEATKIAEGSEDSVATVLREGLLHRDSSLTDAMMETSSADLERYNRGLVILDTAVTLGPLLGLLGTVYGMMHSFGLIGASDLASQQKVITGGIAESLIAVSFGLVVAIVAIVPFNFLNNRLEKQRRKLESAMTRMEILVAKVK
ncbi:MAG: MotA/TolQ/ExbB proton channel family protein [Verrucomicrobiota bacterium]